MKKIYLSAILLMAVLLYGTAGKAQTITNVNLFDSCTGVQMSLSISAASSGLSLVTYWGDGLSTQGSLQAMQTWVFRPHQYMTPGNYSIKNVLLLNNVSIDSTTHSFANFCSYIHITSYLDNDNDCIRGMNDGAYYAPLKMEVDSAGTVIDTFTMLGNYVYKGKLGVTYKFRALNTPLGTSATCPSNGIITVTAPGTFGTTHVNFGVQCGSSSQFDLGVELIGMFRPVATSTVVLYPYNYSCGSQNAVLTLQLNSKYTYKSAIPTPSNVTGNTITWNLNNLGLGLASPIFLYADTATGANITVGDTICNYATITPTTGDVNTVNNNVVRCDRVRASWDPNDKHVYPAGDIDPGTKLTYTINFENLGDDTAFNIYILDTLSSRLDVASIELLHSSHPVSQLLLDGQGGQKIVRFDFKDIHLPDKSSPAYNKGFVQFSINVKNGLAPSTPISNRAGIYFDINPVVITNYAENRITPVSISDVTISNQVTVYPNPVTNVLTIQINNGGYDVLRLLNNMGQVVADQSINSNTNTINLANLPTGMYFLQLTGKNNTITQKIEKH